MTDKLVVGGGADEILFSVFSSFSTLSSSSSSNEMISAVKLDVGR
jgi:hypothetical protein